jgi:hypothetical protein
VQPEVSRKDRWTVFDAIGLAVSALGLVGGCLLGFVVVPAYAKVFADFGGPLPWLTALCLKPWFWVTAACVPPLVVMDGLVRRTGAGGRIARMCVAIGILAALFPVFWVGAYLPIFKVAAEIR